MARASRQDVEEDGVEVVVEVVTGEEAACR